MNQGRTIATLAGALLALGCSNRFNSATSTGSGGLGGASTASTTGGATGSTTSTSSGSSAMSTSSSSSTASTSSGTSTTTSSTTSSTACVQTTHDNGTGQTFTDCSPLDNYTQDSATEACVAYATSLGDSTGDGGLTFCGAIALCGGPSDPVDFVCYEDPIFHECGGPCWGFGGPTAGTVNPGGTCHCPYVPTATWN